MPGGTCGIQGRIMKRTIIAAAALAVALLLAGPAEAGSYWAVAMNEEDVYSHGDPIFTQATAYGSAWNYPTAEEAKERALEECRKRGAGRCYYVADGKDSCFAIFYVINYFHDFRYGTKVTFTSLSVAGDLIYSHGSRAEAVAATKGPWNSSYGPTNFQKLEMVECSGVD